MRQRPARRQAGRDDNFATMRDRLLANGLRDIVTSAAQSLDRTDADARKILCATPQSPACKMKCATFTKSTVNSQENNLCLTLAGFEMATSDPRVVAVNPVMPEDGFVSRWRDYELHMRIFEFLHKTYPGVHISLHAGELAPAWCRPKDSSRTSGRRWRSLTPTHRPRRGCLYEDHPLDLLKEMAQKKVVVEICLSSNDQILGIRGDQHPLPDIPARGSAGGNRLRR